MHNIFITRTLCHRLVAYVKAVWLGRKCKYDLFSGMNGDIGIDLFTGDGFLGMLPAKTRFIIEFSNTLREGDGSDYGGYGDAMELRAKEVRKGDPQHARPDSWWDFPSSCRGIACLGCADQQY